jgi:hypothetical protein
MNKYIPKVGEAFEWLSFGGRWWMQTCIAVTENSIGFEDGRGCIECLMKQDTHFRPIPTKADDERQELATLLRDYVNAEIKATVYVIQQAGFTIPPSIKRSELFQVVANTSTEIVQNDELVVEAICKLLGDLVEQDDKGGAL